MSEGIFPVPHIISGPASLTKYNNGALVGTAGLVIKAAPGTLYRMRVVNNAATAYVLMLHDKATAPIANDTPIWRARIPVSAEIDVDFGLWGLEFSTGISWAISSTVATLTLAIANDVVGSALYK